MDFGLFQNTANFLEKWITPLVELTTDPSQRVYWPFLIFSIVIAAWVSGKKLSLKEQFKVVFSSKGIFHKSSLLDLKLLSLNTALKVFIFPLFLFSVFGLSTELLQFAHKNFSGFTPFKLSPLSKSIAATVIAFLISDFLRFFFHFLMHNVAILRNIHRTHHTAKVLTPFTLFRVHPLEALIGTSRKLLTQALFISVYIFFFGGKIAAIDILGVNAFGFIFNAFGSNIRHMPVPISFGIFEYIFISPRMHQIHHSTFGAHQNKNHGVALSIWDMAFGTFYRPTQEDMVCIQYGITSRPSKYFDKEATQLSAAIFQPIKLSSLIDKNKYKGVRNEKGITSTLSV